jgi:hypothetical protein
MTTDLVFQRPLSVPGAAVAWSGGVVARPWMIGVIYSIYPIKSVILTS